MAILTTLDKKPALTIRNALGRPNQLGEHWLGWTYLGDDNPMCGVYQVRHQKGKFQQVKERHYVPRNTPSSAHTHLRSTFRDGVAEWHGLTDAERTAYNESSTTKGVNGFNKFMGQYLDANL